jgi:hypothetical protein
MAAGVDLIGQMEEISAQETTNSKAGISKVRVLILLIVLVVSMTRGVPVNLDVLQLLIGN